VGDFWRGRAWLGASYPTRGLSVVYPSEEHDLGNFDPQKAPITIPGTVNLIAGTPAALIIGSDQGVWTWDEDSLVRLLAYGTVPGRSADLQDDGSLLFWTTRGLCRAPPLANLTEATVGIEPGLTASGKVLDQYGYRRYVLLVEKQGKPFNIYDTPGGVWDAQALTPFPVASWILRAWSAPTSATLTTGNTTSTLDDLLLADGVDYVVSEVTGAPGWVLDLGFEGLNEVSTLFVLGSYRGNLGHTVEVRAWNYNTSAYDLLGKLIDEPANSLHVFALVDSDHRSNGSALIEIIHTSPGNTMHTLHVDIAGIMTT
jgi:hypothetical protein